MMSDTLMCNEGCRPHTRLITTAQGFVCFMMFDATFNNISVISWVSFIDGGNRSTQRKPPTCHKSLTIT